MRADLSGLRAAALRICAAASAAVLVLAGASVAQAADARLENAEQERVEVQQRLDGLLQRIGTLEAEEDQTRERLALLGELQQQQRSTADAASEALAIQARNSYMRGAVDPTLALLSSGSAEQATEQARVLELLARRSLAEVEHATAARTRTSVTAEEVASAAEELAARQAELQQARDEVDRLLAEATAEVGEVRDAIAREEQARREAEAAAAAEAAASAARAEQEEIERREREAASRARTPSSVPSEDADETDEAPAPRPAAPAGGGDDSDDDASNSSGDSDSSESDDESDEGSSGGGSGGGSSAAVSGGIACPVGQPRTYSDTWGAPRSGGRSHKGTDILAPHGTPIYAYENGTVTRMNGNSLGGISLYLRGDSGNVYYYTHLSGYVGGISAGSSVSAGQQLAYNGDTGNAAGIPHLHFEVMPGGGGSVNPYPYVLRACG